MNKIKKKQPFHKVVFKITDWHERKLFSCLSIHLIIDQLFIQCEIHGSHRHRITPFINLPPPLSPCHRSPFPWAHRYPHMECYVLRHGSLRPLMALLLWVSVVNFILHSCDTFRQQRAKAHCQPTSPSQSRLWTDPGFNVQIHSEAWTGSRLGLSVCHREPESATPTPSHPSALVSAGGGRAQSR